MDKSDETDLPSFRRQLGNQALVPHQRYAISFKKIPSKGLNGKELNENQLRQIAHPR
jgi:hypothetical protein